MGITRRVPRRPLLQPLPFYINFLNKDPLAQERTGYLDGHVLGKNDSPKESSHWKKEKGD